MRRQSTIWNWQNIYHAMFLTAVVVHVVSYEIHFQMKLLGWVIMIILFVYRWNVYWQQLISGLVTGNVYLCTYGQKVCIKIKIRNIYSSLSRWRMLLSERWPKCIYQNEGNKKQKSTRKWAFLNKINGSSEYEYHFTQSVYAGIGNWLLTCYSCTTYLVAKK